MRKGNRNKIKRKKRERKKGKSNFEQEKWRTVMIRKKCVIQITREERAREREREREDTRPSKAHKKLLKSVKGRE